MAHLPEPRSEIEILQEAYVALFDTLPNSADFDAVLRHAVGILLFSKMDELRKPAENR
jgi:hypothetical protein